MLLLVPSVFLLVAVIATVIAVAAPARRSLAATIGLFASIVAVLSLTLVPRDAADEDLQLVPLSHVLEALSPPVDELLVESILNVLLFAPFGAALALRAVSLAWAALAAVALALSVELAQLLLVSGRTTSVDDVLLNTIGALLGHVVVSAWTASRLTLVQ